MHLSHLKLVNFRSFRMLEFDLLQGPTVLMGSNAQGKTTVLEAIYLLAIAKSFRAENEREVVNWQATSNLEQAVVDGVIFGEEGRTRIIVGYQPFQIPPTIQNPSEPSYSVRKEIRVGGVKRTAADLVGLMNVVLFSAEDIDLVQGSPSLRRRYLDILISQADPSYLRSLQRYQRVLYQRNQLLKFLRDGRAKEKELEFWDQELSQEGALITQRRAQAVSAVADTARKTLEELTEGREELQFNYQPSVSPGRDVESTRERFVKALEDSRRREVGLGSTVVGPHRDDFKLVVNGVDMGTYSSRGQARTLALTLRLSEASYLTAYKGQPIVLLDDILSELDAQRRRQVLDRVVGYHQTLITATDLGPFEADFLAQASIYQIKDGLVEPTESASGQVTPAAVSRSNPLTTSSP